MILSVISMLAAVVIVINGLFFVINKMSRHTAHGIRIAWILMTSGASGVLLGVIFGKWLPSLCDAVLLSGVALFMILDRRRPADCGGVQ